MINNTENKIQRKIQLIAESSSQKLETNNFDLISDHCLKYLIF